jgi:hypothetical protein
MGRIWNLVQGKEDTAEMNIPLLSFVVQRQA